MNAATPTPSNPEMAWVTGRPRTSRSIAISSAAATAAPMPQPNPAIALTTTNTTTGRPESTNPIGPPSCSHMVGVPRTAASSTPGSEVESWTERDSGASPTDDAPAEAGGALFSGQGPPDDG